MANLSGALLLVVLYGIITGIQYEINPSAFVLLAVLGGIAFAVSD